MRIHVLCVALRRYRCLTHGFFFDVDISGRLLEACSRLGQIGCLFYRRPRYLWKPTLGMSNPLQIVGVPDASAIVSWGFGHIHGVLSRFSLHIPHSFTWYSDIWISSDELSKWVLLIFIVYDTAISSIFFFVFLASSLTFSRLSIFILSFSYSFVPHFVLCRFRFFSYSHDILSIMQGR